LHGSPLPYAKTIYNRATPISQWTDILDGPADVRKAAAIEVEHIHGPLLMLSSKAEIHDAFWRYGRRHRNNSNAGWARVKEFLASLTTTK
jgi:hypothetical protein